MTLTEAKLVDLVLDLHAQYGGAQPRPNGAVINFAVVHSNTTYQKATAVLEKLLADNKVRAIDLSVTPGPEVPQKFNRSIKFSVARSTLLGDTAGLV